MPDVDGASSVAIPRYRLSRQVMKIPRDRQAIKEN